MTTAAQQARFERLLARALTADDPPTALARAARDRQLSAELRRSLTSVSEDGLRLAALLVARLRFERLLRGSPDAERWFDTDPASFTEAFRRYHGETRLTAFFPAEEARQFQAWRLKETAKEMRRSKRKKTVGGRSGSRSQTTSPSKV
jgi:hypothetical protein